MDNNLRLKAEQLVRKRINDCISPSDMNDIIRSIVVDLHNLYQDSWLFGETKELVKKGSK